MATAAPARTHAHIPPPSAMLALAELPRAFAEFGSLPWAAPLLASAPRGDGHSVLVLPGFMTSDASTTVLRSYLKRLGYDTHAWELGRNLGPRAIGRAGEKLEARLRTIHELTGEKVSLVGWSLGGVMARLIATRAPETVRQVISLGSPFACGPRSTNAWRAYEAMTGETIDSAQTQAMLAECQGRVPVPCTAIYTRGDGVVAWQGCREEHGPLADSIRVYGSHCGLGVNPAVLYAVADRLALPADQWKPFERKWTTGWMYPPMGSA